MDSCNNNTGDDALNVKTSKCDDFWCKMDAVLEAYHLLRAQAVASWFKIMSAIYLDIWILERGGP